MVTAELDWMEPLASLTEALERMVPGRTKAHEIERLLPWDWKVEHPAAAVDARTPRRSGDTCPSEPD